jgi:hypothetical protein
MLRYFKHLSFLLVALLGFTVLSAHAQQNPKRLILKDGSYQSVTQWQVNGDRVRYYSAERYGWEELPSDIVDWTATYKYNKEHERERTVNAEAVAKDDEAARKAEAALTPTVAPGLTLPDSGGVFLLDTFKSQPQLVELVQNGGELNKQTGKNILRAALNPLALSSRQTIELKGVHARVQSHEAVPKIYVNVDTSGGTDNADQQASSKKQDTDQVPDRYRIIRVEQKKDRRIVGNLSIAVYGKVSQKENWIKTVSKPVGDWVEVEPATPLPAGEYALVEMLDKKQMNLYVWDFGVNPAAPANPSAWTPRQPEKSGTGTNQSPVLEKRPPKK